MKELKQIPIDDLRIDGGTQMRAAINQEVVADYAQHIDDMPPSIAFFDGKDYWLADGFHRYHAHRKADKKKVLCEVRNGTQLEARRYARSANHNNGLHRSNEDKRNAVTDAFNDDEWKGWSDRKLADECKVSRELVASVRSSLDGKASDGQERKYTNRHGGTSTMNTDTIAKSNRDRASRKSDDADPDEFFSSEKKNGKHNGTPAPEQKPQIVKDEEGQTIENAKLIEVWQRRGEIDAMLSAVSKLRTLAKKAGDDKDPLFAHLSNSQFIADCGNLYRALRFAKPYAICPYCGGRNSRCKVCRGVGFVGETQFKNYTPEDLKV